MADENRFETTSTDQDDTQSVDSEESVQPPKDGQRWKEYSQDVTLNVVLEKLRDATKKRQEERLKEALYECDVAGVEDNDDVYKAKYILSVIRLQRELMALTNEDNAKYIEDEFQKIKKTYKDCLEDVQWELSMVRQHIWYLKVGVKYRAAYEQQVLSLSPSVISEIRRYSQPTRVVHRIVQAALLILGENEKQTKTWDYCQKRFSPQLVSRLTDFDVSEVHSEIAARAEEMLKLLINELQDGEETIRTSSPSAFTLYVWTQGIVEQRKKIAEDEGEPWTPARLKPSPSRQLQILEEQRQALLRKQREEAEQKKKEAAAMTSRRSKSPKRPIGAGKQANTKGNTTSRRYDLSDD